VSTPKRIKQMRMEAHQQQKKERELRKLFSAPTPKKKEFIPYVPKQIYRQSDEKYRVFPSGTSKNSEAELFKCSTARRETMRYSGDYVTGIATMHKSNLVPVGRGDNPEDYSTMRRN